MIKMKFSLNAYAAINNDLKTRLASSSGGIFSVLAEKIFSINGIVYGVGMSEDCRESIYLRITQPSELIKLRGSKYLQAFIGDTFKMAKNDLEDGKNVMFSGTPCVVNAFKLFLRKNYNNLICIDIICHGVPSPLLWKRYIDYVENKNKKEIIAVNFRCKDENWLDFGIKKDYCGHTVFSPKKTDIYLQLFLSDYCLRPACYKCRAKLERSADLTLGDFWGVEKICPDMNDNNGTSFVICRSEKGNNLFESIKSKIKYKEVTYDTVIPYNIAEIKSVNKPPQRDLFFIDLNRNTIEYMDKKYLSIPLKKKVKLQIKRIIRLIVKNKSVGGKTNLDYGIMFLLRKKNL